MHSFHEFIVGIDSSHYLVHTYNWNNKFSPLLGKVCGHVCMADWPSVLNQRYLPGARSLLVLRAGYIDFSDLRMLRSTVASFVCLAPVL